MFILDFISPLQLFFLKSAFTFQLKEMTRKLVPWSIHWAWSCHCPHWQICSVSPVRVQIILTRNTLFWSLFKALFQAYLARCNFSFYLFSVQMTPVIGRHWSHKVNWSGEDTRSPSWKTVRISPLWYCHHPTLGNFERFWLSPCSSFPIIQKKPPGSSYPTGGH